MSIHNTVSRLSGFMIVSVYSKLLIDALCGGKGPCTFGVRDKRFDLWCTFGMAFPIVQLSIGVHYGAEPKVEQSE